MFEGKIHRSDERLRTVYDIKNLFNSEHDNYSMLNSARG